MELKHDLFFELSTDFLCIADNNGYFLDVNSNFVDALGYTKQEILATPYQSFVHPHDIPKTQPQVERSRAGLDVQNFTNRYRCKDGTYLALAWTARTNPTDGLTYAIARDVTSEYETRLYLEQIEKAISEATIYVETDPNGVITKVNDEFCAISGYARDELIGKTHQIVNSGFHPETFFDNMWQTITEQKIWTGTIKNRRKDGTYYFVKTIIVPIVDSDKNIAKFVAIRQDITDGIEVASALSKANRILNETSSIAKVGGWELEVETGELNWTDETFAILEVEKKSDSKPMLPEGLALFTETSAPVIDRAVSRAIEFGEPYSLELEALTAKGNVKWVYTNGRPTYRKGKVVSLSGTIQDIDSRKKAEIALDLERQKSIQNAKLASLGELAASMAHEVNNPLGIISGNAELLLEIDSLAEPSKARVETIMKSAERISHIVKGLKKFTSKGASKFSTLNFSELTREAFTLAKPRIKIERIEFQDQVEENLWVHGNEIELEQVIVNLINNAIDATENQNDRWIRVVVEKHNDTTQLAVFDSGSGLTEETEQRIFEPFYSTKDTQVNSGLGLSICREILHQHQGTIEVDRAQPHTCFRITLPLMARPGA